MIPQKQEIGNKCILHLLFIHGRRLACDKQFAHSKYPFLVHLIQSMRTLLHRIPQFFIIILITTGLLVWLDLTPDGLLGKMDAIGYSVCHQITSRSLSLADRPLPLCARCSGMYLGAWVGFLYLFARPKVGGTPSRSAIIPLIVVGLLFVVDGVNSYLTLFFPTPLLYPPQNWLRLMTGSGFGLGIAAILVPTFNQTIWQDVTLTPILKSWKSTTVLLLVGIIVNLAMLSENPYLLFPLAVLSSLTVVVVLSLAYTLAWVLITRKENTFTDLKQVFWYLLMGFGTAFLQIALIGAIRFAVTGHWSG